MPALTEPVPEKTRETVAMPTPAAAATSLIVAVRRSATAAPFRAPGGHLLTFPILWKRFHDVYSSHK
ncbi:hypothetical protein GCM10023085_46250 [Actinomadura viridis]